MTLHQLRQPALLHVELLRHFRDAVQRPQEVARALEAQETLLVQPARDRGDHLLGVWTTHIALLVGRPLGLTDVDAVYAGGEEPA